MFQKGYQDLKIDLIDEEGRKEKGEWRTNSIHGSGKSLVTIQIKGNTHNDGLIFYEDLNSSRQDASTVTRFSQQKSLLYLLRNLQPEILIEE
jgi:hypothetical protein